MNRVFEQYAAEIIVIMGVIVTIAVKM